MKLAFVIPWYGKDLPGGAENLCREWAERLQAEVLTTTIKEFQSNWNEPYYRPGHYKENGVLVRRFPLRKGDHITFNYINEKLLNGFTITAEEEHKFLNESANSNELNEFIASHRSEYLFLFIPYLYGTTYWGARAAKDRAVLIPCLHDEPYAKFASFRETFASFRGLIFNSYPEQTLANNLYSITKIPQTVLGLGLNPEIRSNPEAFRQKFNQGEPFLLYIGRKDRTKNTDVLVDYFKQYKKSNPNTPLRLILAGRGNMDNSHPDIRDLGFLDTQDKYNAYAAANLLCNPSINESFSIVLMESWLCGTPALVNSKCPVTRDYVERSKGGLHFSDYYEFEASLNYLQQNRPLRIALATSGATFVRQNFSWPVLLERFQTFVRELNL